MNRLLRSAVALAMTLVLGACGSGSTQSPVVTTAPATAASTPAPATGASASAAAPSPAGGAGGVASCAPAAAGAAATVKVSIKNFAFSPEPVTAKVGDVVGWTNNDSAGHTASLDDGTCTTDTIASGTTQALVFSAPGTYPYHCNIHPTQMKGTITITG